MARTATPATPAPAAEATAPEAPATKAPKAPKARHACECGRWAATAPALSAVPWKHRAFATEAADGTVRLATGCTDTTGAAFAPGHDARLAGLLQTAARAGGTATRDDATDAPAALAARFLSAALARKVAHAPAAPAAPAAE